MNMFKNVIVIVSGIIAIMIFAGTYRSFSQCTSPDKVMVRGMFGWECVSR